MRIAIDTGGTFTDCIFLRDGHLRIVKVFSTPRAPSQAIANALARILAPAVEPSALDLICGTTVGTNALLERRGARVTLVTTAGFEDVLEIGRQARPRLYDFFVQRPEPLVPAARRLGLRERVAADGAAILRPSRAELSRVARAVARTRAKSVAISLLFSFVNASHERAIARTLRARGFHVSVSHEILPEFREFERTATTVINAYLAPVMSGYLAEIEKHAAQRATRSTVRVMQSSGGIISAAVAAHEPVRTVLSGPAGGILGAQYVAERSGFPRIVSFDMGGTSTDVALIEGGLRTTNEALVADLPIAVPVLDIHTVGAGGGSIARFDSAGSLRVGPESAGADPGPICYGRGEKPTVTDAHLVLGRIASENFLGGEFRLDEARARHGMQRALDRAGRPLRNIQQFAQGIIDVANAVMEKAIRVISVERGYDPRDYTLVAFGGAGGLHACELAAALQMQRVLLPKFPGALSALGILRADVVRDFSQTVRLPVIPSAVRNLSGSRTRREVPRSVRDGNLHRTVRQLHRAFAALEARGRREIAAEGFAPRQIRVERLLDARYLGQAYELTVPATGDFVAAFHRAHAQRYGYADPQRAVEIVNVRARVTGATAKPELPRARPGSPNAARARVAVRNAIFAGRTHRAAVYDREKLRAGHAFRGPAIIVEYSATTVLPPGWRARADAYANLILKAE